MVNKLAKWLLLLLLPFFGAGNSSFVSGKRMHPFYVSVTEIAHNASEKTLEVSCKIFVDDMEEILKRAFRTAVNLSNTAQQEGSGALIDKYVQQHLRLSANGKQVALKFIGFEKDSESVYCYFEGNGVPAVKILDVENSLLQDFTQDQINIMHVTVGGRRQSTKLNFPAKSASFSF